MKREYYESPRAIIIKVTPPKCILASADNLTRNSDYSDNYTEDEFWD